MAIANQLCYSWSTRYQFCRFNLFKKFPSVVLKFFKIVSLSLYADFHNFPPAEEMFLILQIHVYSGTTLADPFVNYSGPLHTTPEEF